MPCAGCGFAPQSLDDKAKAWVYSTYGMTPAGLSQYAKTGTGHELPDPPPDLVNRWKAHISRNGEPDGWVDLNPHAFREPPREPIRRSLARWWRVRWTERTSWVKAYLFRRNLHWLIIFAFLLGLWVASPSSNGLPPVRRTQAMPGSFSRPLATRSKFDQPALPLPADGEGELYVNSHAFAPMTITSPHGPENYYVRLTDWQTGEPAKDFFLRSGQTFPVGVPLGNYRLKWATGTTWYGKDFLFGPETRYGEADKILSFTAETEHTVELVPQIGGNLPTHPIDPSQW